MEMMHGFTEVM